MYVYIFAILAILYFLLKIHKELTCFIQIVIQLLAFKKTNLAKAYLT